MSYEEYIAFLNTFHTERADKTLDYESPINGNAFPGEFNVSGFHKEILGLPDTFHSLWGIDKCLRIQEHVSDFHSYIFHMGIFAKSVDLQGEFVESLSDERYKNLQHEICEQFFALLDALKVPVSGLEVTVAGKVSIGGTQAGRDSYLKRTYSLGPDTNAKDIFQSKGIGTTIIPGLANVDIHPQEGALVGLRCEVAFKGIEIATIVFDSFEVQNGHLEPINYVGGYAIGIERLYALLHDGTIDSSIPRYKQLATALKIEDLNTSLVRDQFLRILYGSEVLELMDSKNDCSEHQQAHLRKLTNKVKEASRELGVSNLSA